MWGSAAYTRCLPTCRPALMDVGTTVPRRFARSSIWLFATLLRHYICSFELASVYITQLTCHYLPLAFSTAVHLVGSFQRQLLNFQWIVVAVLWVFESLTFGSGGSPLFVDHVAQHRSSGHTSLHKVNRSIQNHRNAVRISALLLRGVTSWLKILFLRFLL